MAPQGRSRKPQEKGVPRAEQPEEEGREGTPDGCRGRGRGQEAGKGKAAGPVPP